LTQEDLQTAPSSSQKPIVGFRQLMRAFQSLRIEAGSPVLVHCAMSSFGQVQGGAQTVVGALLHVFKSVVVPTFTYNTMVVPEVGPPDNAIQYGAFTDRNMMAEFFHQDLPADRLMGAVAETLRKHTQAARSGHPVLSFAGVNADQYLEKQILAEPLAPIAAMYDDSGYVLLIGVDHTVNTSIHLGERLANRKSYIRWALLPDMAVACPNFPFCSDGFDDIRPLIEPFTRKAQVGNAVIQAIPMPELVDSTRQLIQADPTALLCERTDCLSCNTIRRDIQAKKNAKNNPPS
jgi:aminoglycoside 3-N-acetyltransferase